MSIHVRYKKCNKDNLAIGRLSFLYFLLYIVSRADVRVLRCG